MFKVGQIDTLRLEVEIVNEGEDAHETTLTILLPPAVSYKGATDELKVGAVVNLKQLTSLADIIDII